VLVLLMAIGVGLALCVAGIGYVLVADGQSRAPRAADDDTGLFVAGVVMMFLFPLGGFVAGAVLLPKSPGNGAVIMTVSAAMVVVYVALALAWV
jgi:hypothetical protein